MKLNTAREDEFEPSSAGAIPHALDDQRQEFDHLAATIDQLRKKLDPALGPERPRPMPVGPEPKEELMVSALTAIILDRNSELRRMREQLELIIRSVEL